MPHKTELTKKIKMKALELGFAKVGITNADDFTEYAETLEMGRPEYDFLINRPNGPLAGARLRSAVPEAKSIICTVWDYSKTAYPEKLCKSVARAYQSRGYLPRPDSVNGARIRLFEEYLEHNGCVIHKEIQLPERAACARAGITTYGANNFAYAEGCGSFIILNSIVVDVELEYDEPTIERRCPPHCRRCIDACPTGALAEKGRLIPQRCLAYNHWRGRYNEAKAMPEDMRAANAARIHGCDICQEVCPRNKKVLERAAHAEPFLECLAAEFDLEKILLLEQEYYERVVHPIMYNYIKDYAIFRHNAAIALGNSKEPAHIPALEKALENDNPPFVLEAVQWAIHELQKTKRA